MCERRARRWDAGCPPQHASVYPATVAETDLQPMTETDLRTRKREREDIVTIHGRDVKKKKPGGNGDAHPPPLPSPP